MEILHIHGVIEEVIWTETFDIINRRIEPIHGISEPAQAVLAMLAYPEGVKYPAYSAYSLYCIHAYNAGLDYSILIKDSAGLEIADRDRTG